MTPEEVAAAEELRKSEEASRAAAQLAKRRHETEDEGDPAAPVRMVDLHDVRAELRAELDKLKRAETVPHAVPDPTPAPAQGRSVGVLPGVLGGAVVVLLFLAFAAWKAAKERRA